MPTGHPFALSGPKGIYQGSYLDIVLSSYPPCRPREPQRPPAFARPSPPFPSLEHAPLFHPRPLPSITQPTLLLPSLCGALSPCDFMVASRCRLNSRYLSSHRQFAAHAMEQPGDRRCASGGACIMMSTGTRISTGDAGGSGMMGRLCPEPCPQASATPSVCQTMLMIPPRLQI